MVLPAAAVIAVSQQFVQADAQSTVLMTDLAIETVASSKRTENPTLVLDVESKSVIASSDTNPTKLGDESIHSDSTPHVIAKPAITPIDAPSEDLKSAIPTNDDSWVKLVKGTAKELKKKGTAFTLPSGEVCVKIPNSVIESNRKSWEYFVLGQFYSDPPTQGTLHNIVNGIWSKYYRDISVSKLDGNAFLFRIPNSSTRNHVINQHLWQIEGQTMFVAKWEPCVVPKKPELTSAPIWLELRNVPLQFFHEQGLEHIVGLVGDPKFLHPSTANKTNLEVAKVFTIIDPRKPLREAVNVQFDSSEITRILVSSPWMPPVCSHCKEIGHTLKRCSKALVSCSRCSSTVHATESCPRLKTTESKHMQQKKHLHYGKVAHVDAAKGQNFVYVRVSPKTVLVKESAREGLVQPILEHHLLKGEASGLSVQSKADTLKDCDARVSANSSEVEPDSSDTLSSDHDDEDSSEEVFEKFQKVLSKKQSKVLLPDALDWIVVSIIYASNEESQRQELWAEMVDLASSQALVGKAWIALGDFNQVLSPSEHSRPITLNVDRRTREFRDCLLSADLSDHTFRGNSYTWWNKSKTRPVAKKLDRILVYSLWANSYPDSFATFGKPDFSDHASCGVTLSSGSLKEKRPFKFYNFLLQNQNFLPLVAEQWFTCNVTGSDMLR
ncbi:unnamed protein product, partial [Arabidopsis halleri]